MLRDALAGVTLASMNIPQVLGYARIAGMPAVTGLYTVFLPLVAFALFGASRHLVVAADSATATILASRLSSMAPISSAEYIALAGMVALLTAALLLVARVFKLGFLADFLSRTVLVGFLSGVGVQVGVAMLGDMTGISLKSSNTAVQLGLLAQHLSQVHFVTLGVSLVVVTGILSFKHFLPRFPAPFFAVVLGIAASYVYDFAGHGIAVLGPVAGGLPSLHWPTASWQETLSLLPVAGSCFVMILAQSAATGRIFAQRYHERGDENADILGLAAANAAASVSGTFVVNGSPTQTAMAELAGARSQCAQLVFAGVVVVVLLFLSQSLQYLPHCVLGGIVFTIAIGLIDMKSLGAMRRESPGEFTLALVTAAAVVLVGVEHGILLAIALSLLRHVRHSYHPHTMMMASGGDGRWQPVPTAPGTETAPGLIIYRFDADLFYANERFFVDEVHRLIDQAPSTVRWFVVDAGAITDLDYSAAKSVRELCDSLSQRDISMIFARVNPYLHSDLNRHGIAAVIGEERIFATLHQALDSLGLIAALHTGN
ncbi:SulP family inorganic anion transporter [Neisseriaceae bacterium JH1-16]|nr:SulP family inorganic anion transporter [Neisseriaceae bacterium JH1-16]